MTADVEIVFCDPPAARTSLGNSKWHKVIAELREHPGEWAKIVQFKSTSSARNLSREIRRGAGHWRLGTFESTSRDCDVYARFVGERP